MGKKNLLIVNKLKIWNLVNFRAFPDFVRVFDYLSLTCVFQIYEYSRTNLLIRKYFLFVLRHFCVE